ncbi:hypothetical protein Q0X79_00740 [Neisseria sp. MVDL18-041461]|nr:MULTISPECIES: hypothetical protein [unclassified Neisseria]MDO1508901.1 hypothetical protein [Neisseria sp. MVDL19-042950]MDO1515160.1 hypothetical protein [Neisseria sp. MVDL18-041461]MDO1562520.1 hypothetical protein [Neisseria sp. MVDL20-010259]
MRKLLVSKKRLRNTLKPVRKHDLKEKFSMWIWLEHWIKIIAAVSPIALLLGATLIYAHLFTLNSIGLFSEVISTPSVFFSILILFSFLVIYIFGLPFFAPYNLAKLVNKYEKKNIKFYLIILIFLILKDFIGIYFIGWAAVKKNELIFIFFLTLYYFLFPLFTFLFIKSNNYFNLFLFSIVIFILGRGLVLHFEDYENIRLFWILAIPLTCILLMFFMKNKFMKNIKIKVYRSWDFVLDFFSFGVVFALSNLLLILFVFLISEIWFDSDKSSFLITVIICYLINILPSFGFLGVGKGNNHTILWCFPIMFIILLGAFMVLLPGSQVRSGLLMSLGYIENYQQARWYLIDTRFVEWNALRSKENIKNSMSVDHMETWKKVFQPLPPRININGYKYSNAFYGYIAWNLGNIKIFCPQTIQNNEDINKKCLYIKSEFLQPLPDSV